MRNKIGDMINKVIQSSQSSVKKPVAQIRFNKTMSAQYHPDPETLAEYALGALAPGMELLVSGHLTFCPSCRNRAASYEVLGGATLGEVTHQDVSAPSLETTLAMLDITAPSAPLPSIANHSIFPTSLRPFISADEESIDWSFRLPGMYEHELAGFGSEAVSLLKAKPGAKMLSHTHDGEEATLILTGQMQDGSRVYRKGDVAQADHDQDHTPEIIGDEMCICLIVMSGKVRFTGILGRALNVLMR